jgi:imidazolonepropionase-like amidohydrolase
MRQAANILIFTLVLVIGWLAGSAKQRAGQATAAGGKKLALVGGMLLTGYEVPPIHHAAIIVEGNRIVAAGPASAIAVPSDATVIDTSGRTMLPGLIETHGHLIVLGHGAYDSWFSSSSPP